MDEHGQAIAAFEKARGNDGLISPKEQKELLNDLTLSDWQAIGNKYNKDNSLMGVMRTPVLQITQNEVLINNDEQTVREQDMFQGLKGFFAALGTGAGGMGAGYMIGRTFMDSWKPAKWIGLGVGLLAGQKLVYPSFTREIEDVKKNAMPLRVRIDALKPENQ